MTIAIPKQTRPFILAFVGHRRSPDETILAANGEVGNFKSESHQRLDGAGGYSSSRIV